MNIPKYSKLFIQIVRDSGKRLSGKVIGKCGKRHCMENHVLLMSPAKYKVQFTPCTLYQNCCDRRDSYLLSLCAQTRQFRKWNARQYRKSEVSCTLTRIKCMSECALQVLLNTWSAAWQVTMDQRSWLLINSF